MDVASEIVVYEVNGNETKNPERLLIKSHWNRDSMVVIVVDENKSLTVAAESLRRAIQNATNWKR